MFKKPIVIITIILVLACVAIYLYKDQQVKAVRTEANKEKLLIIETSKSLISLNNEQFLRLLNKPFSWALRTALLNGNIEQVNQYLYDFVKNKNFELILLADPSGKIISSTDKKLEGADFSSHFDGSLLMLDSIAVNNSIPGKIIVVSPVMGFNSKLATMLSVYIPDEINNNSFEKPVGLKIDP